HGLRPCDSVLRKPGVDGCRQIVHHARSGGKAGFLAGFHAVARQDEPRRTACGRSGLQVAQRVSRCRNALQIDVVAAADVVEEPRTGLAAGASIVGAVRADEAGVYGAAGMGDFPAQLGMYAVGRVQADESAGDTGLIAGVDAPPPRARQPRDGFQAARQGDPLVGMLDEGGAVLVDDAVAVEDGELHCASLEMSATWFMT